MVDRFINFFFSDVFELCIYVQDLVYVPLSELSSFMFCFSAFSAVCLTIGFCLAELLGLFIPFVWRRIRNWMKRLQVKVSS